QMDHVAMTIRNDLKFNVMRIDDELLEINLIVSESFLAFVRRPMKGWLKARFILRHAHSASAAASGRFDHYRITDFLRDFDRVALSLDNAIASWRHGHAGFSRRSARWVLIAHRQHSLRRRPNELDIAAFTDFREMGVLGEKSIAGMNRIDIADLCSAHDAIDFKVALRAGRRANANGFVCKLYVK